jgi:hypothetical protein
MVFWFLTPCSSATARRFGGTYRFRIQGRKVNQEKIQKPCLWIASAAWLFLDPEGGGDTFLRNVGLSPNYTTLKPLRPHCPMRTSNSSHLVIHQLTEIGKYCHAFSDRRRVLDCQLDLLQLYTQVQYN